MSTVSLESIEINGVTYAPVQQDTAGVEAPSGSPVVVCGGETGRAVLFGYTNEPIVPGEPYTLRNARMLLYWPAACGGLLGFVQEGPKVGTRLSKTVDEVSDAIAHQWMPVSPAVAAQIGEWDAYVG